MLASNKHSSIIGLFISDKEKKIMTLTPGLNVLKLFADIIIKCSLSVRVFVSGKPLQPSLMLTRKVFHSRVGS